MVEPAVVSYLQQNMKKFPIDELRRQLASEGVSDQDFDDALKAALRSPRPSQGGGGRAKAARVLMAAGGAAAVLALLIILAGLSKNDRSPSGSSITAASQSAYVGHYGYVISLPPDYAAVQSFKDSKKTLEVVHFCKTGTDPTNFLDEGLYGQLGIVRLEVEPNPWAGVGNGLDALSSAVTSRAQKRGEKFSIKPVQVSSLRGIQLNFEGAFPRVESYILGQNVLYSFLAGEDDEIYHGILTGLRDTRSEN